MHEMSIAENLLELAIQEAARQGCDKLLRLRVEYGPLAGLMPDALDFCFSALIKGTIHENARLELVALPLLLSCPLCGARFGGEDKNSIWLPCPQCGEEFGHTVIRGNELVLAQIEAARSDSELP